MQASGGAGVTWERPPEGTLERGIVQAPQWIVVALGAAIVAAAHLALAPSAARASRAGGAAAARGRAGDGLGRRVAVAAVLGALILAGLAFWGDASALAANLSEFAWWTFGVAILLASANYALR